MFDPLPADLDAAVREACERFPSTLTLHYASEIASTNDAALALAMRGAADATAVMADAQTEGRGRRGRSWFSPPGAGIYLSSIVRPAPQPASALALLSLAAGVATAAAIETVTGLPVELKWPNDIVIGRPWRKVAGILCESTGGGRSVDAVVVGIGANVQPAAYPPELSDRATSIEVELGRPVERARLAIEILGQLFDTVSRLRRGDRAGVLDDWRERGRAGLAGARVRWQNEGRERRGVARGIDDEGALIVMADGRTERLIAGEVTWEPLI